jgi:hypothetical protein
LNIQKTEMATVENIRNAVTSAVSGAHYGIHRGNQVVGAAKAIDSFMGGQAPRSGRVGAAIEGYAGGKRADGLRQEFARTNPRSAPTPRTAAYYAYRIGRPNLVARNDPSAGTPTQHDMLNRLRMQQERIRAARTTARVGRFRDQSAPTEDDFITPAPSTVGVERNIAQFASTPSLAEKALGRQLTPEEREERRRQRKPPPWAKPRRVD